MTELQTKRPNINNHIAIYYTKPLDDSILSDPIIQDVLDLCGSYDFFMNFTYAIYADHSKIKNSLFIPVFHSFYLNSDPKIVILTDPKNSQNIIELYPYHRFYSYGENNDVELLQKQFSGVNFNHIISLKDL